jgi:hypothetical protein
MPFYGLAEGALGARVHELTKKLGVIGHAHRLYPRSGQIPSKIGGRGNGIDGAPLDPRSGGAILSLGVRNASGPRKGLKPIL